MVTVTRPSDFSLLSGQKSLTRYDCRISHTRRTPLKHRFAYRSPMWLVDVDRVAALPRLLRFVNRFDVVDHWATGTATLRSGLDSFLAAHGAERPARALLLTGARSFGHCFNPLSVWWCYDATGRRTAVVAEVHNTYRGRHAYLLDLDDSGADTVDKTFYVSPFFAAEGRYRMRIGTPGERLQISIALELDGRVPFTATLLGRRHQAGPWGLLRHPLAQLRVAALIRFEGIRLWRRKLPIQPRTGTEAIEQAAAGNLGVHHGA